jgi:uncharacterized protein (DUF2267 family)
MTTNGLAVFDETVQKTNTWLKDIAKALGTDRRQAYRALRAALHCLRDRLPVNEAAQLGDQLPMLVRGVYYEGWHPAGKPLKIRSSDEFLDGVAAGLSRSGIDAGNAVRAVLLVLQDHVTAGEIEDVIQVLPRDIRALWPAGNARHSAALGAER